MFDLYQSMISGYIYVKLGEFQYDNVHVIPMLQIRDSFDDHFHCPLFVCMYPNVLISHFRMMDEKINDMDIIVMFGNCEPD